MEIVAVKAAGWVVGKALGAVTGTLLEAWAASKGLGAKVDALKVELLYAQALLDNTKGREIHSPALKELLLRLQQLAYGADDVLDELEYFRIQDELDGTYHAADSHAGGCVQDLILNARHVAGAVAAKLRPSSCGSRHGHTIGEHDEQDSDPKHGCLSSVVCCSCGGATVTSSPPSPTNQDDQNNKVHGGCMQKLASNASTAACPGNGRGFFSCAAALPSKVKGCLCGKREMMTTPPASPTNKCEKNPRCGCLLNVTPTACDTAKSVGKCLPCFSFQSVDENAHTSMSDNIPDMLGKEKRFLFGAWTSKAQERKHTNEQAPKLKFNRVGVSAKMEEITEHLKYVCAKVSNVLNLEFMGTSRTTRKDLANKRPMTTPEITEPQLYGREQQKKIIHDIIVHGNPSSDNDLVVLPIVGPGGIGKTTFTQHIYEEVKNNPFEVTIWICVSLNFNAGRLVQEAMKKIPKVDNEKEHSSIEEITEQRLKAKRFLLVLDDMWECHEDEWKKLLAPFRRGGQKGSMVIVTTRIRKVAEMVIKTVHYPIIEMERLEGEDFMHFFEACIFGGQQPWEGHTDLREIGENIVSKLKGFPLAAKTVGGLLRNQLTFEHWTKALESKEWELETNDNDIMPALKLSYDYLPFHLQQCFYYCALFPEDYEFDSKELVLLWIGLDIIQPCDLRRRIDDVGLCYLNDLVNHGFLKKNKRSDGSPYYVVHDLLHDLAVNISAFECLNICSSNVKSIYIRQDIRHLSIIVDDKDVEDIKTFKYYKNDLSALDKRLNIENLRTLMVFGEHSGSFAKTFCSLFQKARALRTVYLSGASSNLRDTLCNFSELIHLRYLSTKPSSYMASYKKKNIHLPSALSRLYHLEVIDLHKWEGCYGLTRHMRNLAKLRHFLVPEHGIHLHSDIVDVGKLKLLQELRSFDVKKESKGFELHQLGKLLELGGSLAICSLERIQAMEEAHEARLVQIKHLQKLTLEWDANRPKKDTTREEDALEILIPHSNLQDLCIRGHGGTKCPRWLGENLSIKNLKSLHLDGVSWNTFPPIGEMWIVHGPHEEISSNIHHEKFHNLRILELVKLPRLKNWVINESCHLFAHLEVLIIRDCYELTNISFSHSACCQGGKEEEANMNWFPSGLQELEITRCPKLLSFPPVPWKQTLCSAKIMNVGLGLNLSCEENQEYGYRLWIEPSFSIDDGTFFSLKEKDDGTFWNVLAFDNLTELKELTMQGCPPLPLGYLKTLSSLKIIRLYSGSSIDFPWVEGKCHVEYQSPVEFIIISMSDASAKELTQLLTYFPKLSKLSMWDCKKITGLAVVEEEAKIPMPASSGNKVGDDEEIQKHQQHQEGTRGEEEIDASSAEGLLLLPSQLQELEIRCCQVLNLCSTPSDHNREARQTCGGQGLQGLTSLRLMTIDNCPRFLSLYSSTSSSSCFPFPTSLEDIHLSGAVGTATLLPLSNLTSLIYLSIQDCEDLRGEGLWSLLSQGRLTYLVVRGTPNFFAGSQPSLLHEQEFPSSSSKLKELETDDIEGVLAAPICTFLSFSLTDLRFCGDKNLEHFTKDQDEALQLLISLEEIRFWECKRLQGLPTRLHRLPNLMILNISKCIAIQSLPKDGLLSALQELVINTCPAIRSLPKDCLPSSLQILGIKCCPAIRSLPKVPSSLQRLDVQYSESKELRRQCHKLIGTIPIVET